MDLLNQSPVSVSQMQAIESVAIEQLGIPRMLLMDHAGLAAARQAAAFIPGAGRSVFVACGRGYNGGDGLSAARHLAGWGYPVVVGLIGPIAALRVEPAIFARCLSRQAVPIIELAETLEPVKPHIQTCGAVVDALLGIGLSGSARGVYALLIEAINRSNKPVVSVDVPSGINCDTGEVQGLAVQAAVTVAFGRIKKGCTLGEGAKRSGRLLLEPITFPNKLLRS